MKMNKVIRKNLGVKMTIGHKIKWLITVAVFIHHDQYVSQMWIYFFICILSIVYTCILKALWKTKASIKNTKFYLVLCFFYWRTFYFWDNLFMTTDYSAEPPGSEKLSSLIILNWHWYQSIREWITIIVI